jgi:hypothetical protein
MKKLSLSFFSFILLLIGCAEKPKNIGGSLIDPNDDFSIADIVFASASDTSYRIAYAPGFGSANIVGRLSNNDEVISLFNFTPGGTIDSLKNAQIDTVELSLYVNYRLQPSAPMIEFDVKKIETSWGQSSFTYDSLISLTVSADSILGTFKDSMNYGATPTAQINKDYIRRWADSYIDTGNHDHYYGFTVQARTVPTGLIGFSTFSSSGVSPRLLIKYTKNGTRDSIVVVSGEDTFVSKFAVTPIYTPITVHAAFGVRSRLKFNLNALANSSRKDTAITINKATVELTLDSTASSFSGYSPDTVVAFLGMKDQSKIDSSNSEVAVFGYKKEIIANQSPVYSFQITKITQQWIDDSTQNYGLTLRWAAEFGTAEKAVFFSSTAADVTKRPKIKITYSKK